MLSRVEREEKLVRMVVRGRAILHFVVLVIAPLLAAAAIAGIKCIL